MNARTLACHRTSLLTLREEILREGPIPVEPIRRDPTEVGGDEDEQPLAEMMQVIASNRNKSRAGELARIEVALRRLAVDPDDFGLCLDCEEPIAPGRLAALPYVERCTDCQGRLDAPRTGSRRHLTDFR